MADNTTSDAYNWANLAYAWYRDRNPPKPNFEQVPLSPQEQQIYDIYIRSLINPATQNNASQLNQMATQMLGSLNGMQWQSPRTFSGDVGYRGTQWNFTPPTSGPAGPAAPMPTPPTGGGNPNTNTNPEGVGAQGYNGEPSPNRGDWDMSTPKEWSAPMMDADGGFAGNGVDNPWIGMPGMGGGWKDGIEPNDIQKTKRLANPRNPNNVGYTPSGREMPINGDSFGNFWNSITKAAGPWNQREETYERWIARGASLVAGAFGLPIPPNLIDKGIDAVQWLYRRVGDGRNSQSAPDLGGFYSNPTTPAPGVGMTGGKNTGFGDFGKPGSIGGSTPPSNTSPYSSYDGKSPYANDYRWRG